MLMASAVHFLVLHNHMSVFRHPASNIRAPNKRVKEPYAMMEVTPTRMSEVCICIRNSTVFSGYLG